MRTKLITCLTALLFLFIGATKADAQQWAVSTNGLYWLTATPNIGLEYSFHKKMSAAVSLSYNPFTFAKNRKWKHLLFQPEYRYWVNEAFKGHYFGAHFTYALFNFSGLPLSDSMRDYRYEGDAYGAGLTYGYQWSVGKRLNLGAEIGFGYLSFKYDKFYCQTCGERIEHYKSSYFGPTKAGVNLIYLF